MKFGHPYFKQDHKITTTILGTKVLVSLVPSDIISSTTVIQIDKTSGPLE